MGVIDGLLKIIGCGQVFVLFVSKHTVIRSPSVNVCAVFSASRLQSSCPFVI